MSIFNSTQVDPDVIPYINKGQGVGIVKIKDRGKYSAIISEKMLLFKSYENSDAFKIPIEHINFIQYKEGNFINEPKLILGVPNQQYILAGVDNNDEELFAYYNSLLNIKNHQQQKIKQNSSSLLSNKNKSMPQPNRNITNPNKMPNLQNNPIQNQQDIQKQNDLIKNQSETITNDMTQEDLAEDINMEVQIDPADEIRKYFQLKEDGIITEEEFNQKKKQLLDL